MIEPNCTECEKQGVIRKAHRIVGRAGLCNDHYLKASQVSAQVAHAPVNGPRTNLLRPWETPGEATIPEAKPAAPAKEEDKQMPVARTDVDWDAVRKEYQAGAGAANIAEKYGVHVSSVYMHVKGLSKKPAASAAKAPRVAKANGAPPAKHTGSAYDQVITELRHKRDVLNQVIEQLEGL